MLSMAVAFSSSNCAVIRRVAYFRLINYACQFHANMRLPLISLIAAFFAYFRKARTSHIFSAQIGIFDGNFNIICVSLTYLY